MKKITFFVLCIFIGITMVVAVRSVGGRMVYVSAKSLEDYRTQIKAEKIEVEKLKAVLKTTEGKLKSYTGGSAAEDEINEKKLIEDLSKDLIFYKMASGNQKVSGAGISIKIDDGTKDIEKGEDVNNVLVHDEDIIEIINSLNTCNAEAISVNGQRVTARSSITCNGYTIKINDRVYARPFVIKAIGNPVSFTENLLAPEGYGTKLRNYGVKFSMKTSDKIVIKPLAEPQTEIYMTVVKEGAKKK